jgi:hypothetical protein
MGVIAPKAASRYPAGAVRHQDRKHPAAHPADGFAIQRRPLAELIAEPSGFCNNLCRDLNIRTYVPGLSVEKHIRVAFYA